MPLGELVTEHPPKNKLKRQITVPVHSDTIRFYVVHKNYENLLQSETLGKLYRYTNEILRVTAQYEGTIYHFESFCKKEPNEQNCSNSLNVWLKHADILFRDDKTKNNPNLQLSYPVMYLFNRPKDIGNRWARVLTLHWFVEFPSTAELEGAYLAYREAMTEFWKVKSLESGLDFIPHNGRAMDDEMRLIIETAVPFAIPVSIQLMLFVVLSNYSSDRTKSKPMEAYLAPFSFTFPTVMVYGGRKEAEGGLMSCCYRNIPLNKENDLQVTDSKTNADKMRGTHSDENQRHKTIGRVSTNFWLWEYQRFLNDFPDVEYETGFYDQKYLSDFFSQFDYQQYPHVKMKANSTNGEPCIAAFTFQTSFYGLDSWDKRQVSNLSQQIIK
uniref:Uncharacterized protein n=1 Tax=Parascaris equorum TaxID=6256 RepID=A0A914RP55_PAREQ